MVINVITSIPKSVITYVQHNPKKSLAFVAAAIGWTYRCMHHPLREYSQLANRMQPIFEALNSQKICIKRNGKLYFDRDLAKIKKANDVHQIFEKLGEFEVDKPDWDLEEVSIPEYFEWKQLKLVEEQKRLNPTFEKIDKYQDQNEKVPDQNIEDPIIIKLTIQDYRAKCKNISEMEEEAYKGYLRGHFQRICSCLCYNLIQYSTKKYPDKVKMLEIQNQIAQFENQGFEKLDEFKALLTDEFFDQEGLTNIYDQLNLFEHANSNLHERYIVEDSGLTFLYYLYRNCLIKEQEWRQGAMAPVQLIFMLFVLPLVQAKMKDGFFRLFESVKKS